MDLFDKERKLDLQKRVGGDNLLSALIRSTGEDSKGGLNDAEVLGNLIIYSIAGHETTAGTLSYSILLLAAYPEWQDWIAEEIHTVLQGQKSPEIWGYEKLFPQLKRCLAVLVRSDFLFLFCSWLLG